MRNFRSERAQAKEIEAYRQNNAGLMREGFKVETLISMMDYCSDKCKLQYHAAGIRDSALDGVACYTNCVTKSYKLSNGSFN